MRDAQPVPISDAKDLYILPSDKCDWEKFAAIFGWVWDNGLSDPNMKPALREYWKRHAETSGLEATLLIQFLDSHSESFRSPPTSVPHADVFGTDEKGLRLAFLPEVVDRMPVSVAKDLARYALDWVYERFAHLGGRKLGAPTGSERVEQHYLIGLAGLAALDGLLSGDDFLSLFRHDVWYVRDDNLQSEDSRSTAGASTLEDVFEYVNELIENFGFDDQHYWVMGNGPARFEQLLTLLRITAAHGSCSSSKLGLDVHSVCAGAIKGLWPIISLAEEIDPLLSVEHAWEKNIENWMETVRNFCCPVRDLFLPELNKLWGRIQTERMRSDPNPSEEELSGQPPIDSRVVDALRRAIAIQGKDAKVTFIIRAAHVGSQKGRRHLRHLQELGEYTGFQRHTPNRYRKGSSLPER